LLSAIAIGIDNRLRSRPATRALGAGLGKMWNRFCRWLARDVEDELPW
jgi:hypothetical protein